MAEKRKATPGRAWRIHTIIILISLNIRVSSVTVSKKHQTDEDIDCEPSPSGGWQEVYYQMRVQP